VLVTIQEGLGPANDLSFAGPMNLGRSVVSGLCIGPANDKKIQPEVEATSAKLQAASNA